MLNKNKMDIVSSSKKYAYSIDSQQILSVRIGKKYPISKNKLKILNKLSVK